MFRGRFEHSIDGKGRTSLPSHFREVLTSRGESRLVITTGLDPCLVAYSVPEWDKFEERLSALPQFDESVAMLRRVYVSGAVECEIDKLGRLLIPATLRQHAGLKSDIIWAGMGRHLEVWAKNRFEKLRNDVIKDADARRKMASHLAELGL